MDTLINKLTRLVKTIPTGFNVSPLELRFKRFSTSDNKQIERLTKLTHQQNYSEIAKLDWESLRPEENGYDALKLIFLLIATVNLNEKSTSLKIFRKLFFDNSLRLSNEEEEKYLKIFTLRTIRSIYDNKLKDMPKDVREAYVENPNLKKVPDDIKNLFILNA